jgi:hypothetical protein
MLINSSSGTATLRLEVLERSRASGKVEEVSVRLEGPCEAAVNVYDDHFESLAAFFRDLAEHWRGWEGSKSWESLEGELSLVASTDKAGHVRLQVTLMDLPAVERWRAEASLFLDAGGLHKIAENVEHLLSVEGAA